MTRDDEPKDLVTRLMRSPLARRASMAVLGSLALGGLIALPALDVRLDPRALLPDAPDLDRAESSLAQRFGQPRGPIVLVRVHAPDVMDTAALTRIHRLTGELEAMDEVESVRSPTSIPLPVTRPVGEEGSDGELEALLDLIEGSPEVFPDGLVTIAATTGGPTAMGRPFEVESPDRAAEALRAQRTDLEPLVAADGGSALLVVRLREGADDRPVTARLANHRALRPEITGAPVLERALREALIADAPMLVGLAMLANALVLLLAMRSRRGLALPMGAAGASLAIFFVVMVAAGQPFTLLHAMLPPLLLTVAISDAIHILFRQRDNQRKAQSAAGNLRERGAPASLGRQAERRVTELTAREMAGACLTTSLTTAAGFGALVLARTPAVRELAIWTVVGVAIAYLVTLVFVVANLRGAALRPRSQGRTAVRVASGASKWPRAFLAGWLLLGAAGLVLGLGVERGSRLLAPFPAGLEAAEVARVIDLEHGGARRLEVLSPDAATTRALTADLLRREAVTRVESAESMRERVWRHLVGEPLPLPTDDASRSALRFLAGPGMAGWEDGAGAQRLEVSLRDVTAETIVAIVRGLERAGASAVVGEAARASLAVATIEADLARTFGFALVSIFLLVGLMLRRVRLGLIALLPNLLPLAVGLGWMGLRRIPLDASTAMVFAATLGLAVDGTVHALVRFRAQSSRGAERIERTFREAGPGILVGGATLLAGFAALFASDLPPVRAFAELASVTLLVATLAELTLLPALLRLFGGR